MLDLNGFSNGERPDLVARPSSHRIAPVSASFYGYEGSYGGEPPLFDHIITDVANAPPEYASPPPPEGVWSSRERSKEGSGGGMLAEALLLLPGCKFPGGHTDFLITHFVPHFLPAFCARFVLVRSLWAVYFQTCFPMFLPSHSSPILWCLSLVLVLFKEATSSALRLWKTAASTQRRRQPGPTLRKSCCKMLLCIRSQPQRGRPPPLSSAASQRRSRFNL